MMAMGTVEVRLVGVLLEDVVVVIWLEEVEDRWCVTIVTKLAIWLVTVGTPPQPVDIAAQ